LPVYGKPARETHRRTAEGKASQPGQHAHRRFGVDGFIGDGKLKRASEHTLELLYNLHVYRSLLVSADYQHISNPGYNADRGPVNVLAGRVHAEF